LAKTAAKRVYIPEMTWTEIREVLPKVRVAVIPTGSTEQHGPHLPLQSDTAFCLYLCRRAAEQVYPTTLVTPPVATGISSHHMKFPGTLTLRPETFIEVLYDIAESLKHHGIRKLAIIDGHGGNTHASKIAARKIYDNLQVAVASFAYWDLFPEDGKSVLKTRVVPGHADEFETSISYVIQPELVRKDAIPESDGIRPSKYQELMSKYDTDISSSGVPSGEPKAASKEKGERLVEATVEELRKFLLYYAEYGDGM